MGIGIFAVWPLAKKLGKKNLTAAGFIVYAVGSLICWIAPTSMPVVLVGQFIKNIGGLPCAYVFMALFADALDNLEWKNGFRCDGIAMSAYSVIVTAAAGIVTGIFNGGLSAAGYLAPETVSVMPELTDAMQKISTNADGTFSIIFNQPDSVNTIFTFFFVGLEAIAGFVYAFMLLPVTVEKTVGKKLVMIRARQKTECEARGEVWVEPEVRAAEDQKQLDKEAEEIYRKELKERCEKKGLNYNTELEKHIKAVRIKEEKQAEKERLAAFKADEKAKIAADKKADKLAKMTPEQCAKYEARQAERSRRDEEKWQKEKAAGEKYYKKMQKALAEYEARAN